MSSIELTKADRLTDMDTTNECQSKHNQGHPTVKAAACDKAGGHTKRNSEYDDLEDITLTLTKVITICEPRTKRVRISCLLMLDICCTFWV